LPGWLTATNGFLAGHRDEKSLMEDFQKQALTEHLAELRSCLINSLLAVAVGFAAAYFFVEKIGYWFLKPLYEVLPEQSSIIFTSYQEAFFFI
jgi:Sec-independent protein secretion pathway component TatC